MENTGRDGFREMDAAIDIGCISLGATEKRRVGEDCQFTTYLRRRQLRRDGLLHEHGLALTALLGPAMDLTGKFGGA
jgi:hypothetical protein